MRGRPTIRADFEVQSPSRCRSNQDPGVLRSLYLSDSCLSTFQLLPNRPTNVQIFPSRP